jgi:hypothetical protein
MALGISGFRVLHSNVLGLGIGRGMALGESKVYGEGNQGLGFYACVLLLVDRSLLIVAP